MQYTKHIIISIIIFIYLTEAPFGATFLPPSRGPILCTVAHLFFWGEEGAMALPCPQINVNNIRSRRSRRFTTDSLYQAIRSIFSESASNDKLIL